MSLHVTLTDSSGQEVYSANITHNLVPMAREAGIYWTVWRPEEVGITHARQLIGGLELAIADMKAYPEKYKRLDSPNGWGLYKNFLPWLERYLEACKANPDALVSVCR